MTSISVAPRTTSSRLALRALAERRFEASMELPTRFFEAHSGMVSRACLAMADRFREGGRLLVFGEGAAVSDAHHVAVEFVHPVLVGKRALPALSLAADAPAQRPVLGSAPSEQSRMLEILGRPADIALAISTSPYAVPAARWLASARRMGMLTIGLYGSDAPPTGDDADFLFAVPSDDVMLVQEVHETLYHVLWELVHVFLDQGARE